MEFALNISSSLFSGPYRVRELEIPQSNSKRLLLTKVYELLPDEVVVSTLHI
jgi:hypothetical protein